MLNSLAQKDENEMAGCKVIAKKRARDPLEYMYMHRDPNGAKSELCRSVQI